MATYDAGAASNMLHGYAYEGVWEKYNEPLFRRWVWTLTASRAIFVLGAYALLLTLTQSRTWVVVRYLVLSRKKAVRLDGDSRLDPLERFSQDNALKDMFPLIEACVSRLWHRCIFRGRVESADSTVEAESSIISLWLSIFALINIVVFGCIGVALPVVLSEGVLGAPLVKSKLTTDCLHAHVQSFDDRKRTLQMEQQARTDAVFNVCLDPLSMRCGRQYYLQQPQISRSRAPCPLTWDICHNGTEAFSLTHSNISARELGVNSRSTLSINHRLTCAPVHLDPFLVLDLHEPGQTLVSVQQNQTEMIWEPFVMALHTRNGPNTFSPERSGRLGDNIPRTRDFTILPRESSWSLRYSEGNSFEIHKALRSDHGASFLAILRPGRKRVRSEINDPFFSAHDEYVYYPPNEPPGRFYFPDFEATALGCLEQFQFCIHTKGVCTNWGELSERLPREVEAHLDEDPYSIAELRGLFMKIPSAISVADYLRTRVGNHQYDNVVPLTNSAPWMNRDETPPQNSKDQWITEVEVWFMKGILNAVLFTENGARTALPSQITLREGENDIESGMNYSSEHSLCGRILFRDADYTNINLVGFLTSVGLFVLICIASYGIKSLEKTAETVWGVLDRAFRFHLMRSFMWKVQLFLKTLGPTNWIAAGRRQLPEAVSELQYMERFPGPVLGVAGQSVETG